MTDVVLLGVVSVMAFALAPIYYDMIALVRPHAGPFGDMLLELIVPFVFLGIIISAGVSARGQQ